LVTTRIGHVSVFVIMTALLLWPAFWNGAPLFYYDSVDYLVQPFTGEMPVFRTAPYGWFQWLARLGGNPWPTIVAQAAMVTGIAWLSVDALVPGLNRLWLLAGVAVLSWLTGLSWYVSQVMADSLTGAVFLGAIALACGRRLPLVPRILLMVLTALGMAFHVSHIAVICGLVLCVLAARLASLRVPSLRFIRARDLVLTLALSVTTAVFANYATTGRVFLLQNAANLRLALLIETGLVKDYLDEVCPQNQRISHLCPYRKTLPTTANAYLWNTFGPFHDLGGWKSELHKQEAATIVGEILRRYPGETAARLGTAAFRQFGMVETGDGLRPMFWHLEKPIARFYPGFLEEFRRARQQHHIEFSHYAVRDDLVYWLSLAGMVGIALFGWQMGSRAVPGATALVFLILVGNAVVCGALSNPNHRYQGRIAWLPLFAMMLGAAELARLRRREGLLAQAQTSLGRADLGLLPSPALARTSSNTRRQERVRETP